MIVAGMQDDEIDHVAEPDAVSQVSENARKQQRTRAEDAIVVSRRAQEVIENGDGREYCQHDEEPATKRATFLQLSKRDTGVFGVDELKEPANDHALITEAQRPDSPRLRRLIRQVDAEGSQQIPGAPREARAKFGGRIVNA